LSCDAISECGGTEGGPRCLEGDFSERDRKLVQIIRWRVIRESRKRLWRLADSIDRSAGLHAITPIFTRIDPSRHHSVQGCPGTPVWWIQADTANTGSPNADQIGDMPSPGAGDDVIRPLSRSGAPSAMPTVT